MPRKLSMLVPNWWDYTTLDDDLLKDAPPTQKEFRELSVRVLDLHPVTCMQNARTSSGGVVTEIPIQAITVGPVQTRMAECVNHKFIYYWYFFFKFQIGLKQPFF